MDDGRGRWRCRLGYGRGLDGHYFAGNRPGGGWVVLQGIFQGSFLLWSAIDI